MTDRNNVLESIYKAIDQVNMSFPEDRKIPKTGQTRLIGKDSAIDSLGLTLLIVAIEEKIDDDFQIKITLVDGQTMSEDNSPFRSIETLADYIIQLMN